MEMSISKKRYIHIHRLAHGTMRKKQIHPLVFDIERYIEAIQMFRLNMTSLSSSEAKNLIVHE